MHKGYVKTKRLSLSSLSIISKHRTAFLVGTFIPSILGIFLAEIIMAAQFNALQPILAGMALITVEIFGIFLVDFPMSVIAGCIIARKTGLSESKYGALAGASFLTVFIILVGFMGILHNFTTYFDVFGLGNAVILAAQTAFQQFGSKLVVMLVMLFIFDYFLCMLGGILGFNIVQLFYPSNYNES